MVLYMSKHLISDPHAPYVSSGYHLLRTSVKIGGIRKNRNWILKISHSTIRRADGPNLCKKFLKGLLNLIRAI